MPVAPAVASPRHDHLQVLAVEPCHFSSVTRVIVTRPEREAQAWLQAMLVQGWDALCLPLIQIGAAPDREAMRAVWHSLDSPQCPYQALMFVSAAAVRGFWEARPASGQSVFEASRATPRCWATGPGTRRALLLAGVAPSRIDAPPADAGQFDSEALWRVVGVDIGRGARVLVVRGADAGLDEHEGQSLPAQGVGRDWLAQSLSAAGADVDFLVSYVRSVPSWDAAQLALARGAATDGSVWLFSSSQALSHLRHLLPGQDWSEARALVSHPRIEKAAQATGFGAVKLARPMPDELIASIESFS